MLWSPFSWQIFALILSWNFLIKLINLSWQPVFFSIIQRAFYGTQLNGFSSSTKYMNKAYKLFSCIYLTTNMAPVCLCSGESHTGSLVAIFLQGALADFEYVSHDFPCCWEKRGSSVRTTVRNVTFAFVNLLEELFHTPKSLKLEQTVGL